MSMKLVAMLRVKDEIMWIEQCLARLSEFVDEIVILDNGSTDGTIEVYKNFPKIRTVLKTEGYHEGRDKIMLHEAAKELNPDWIIWCDGDELFEPAFDRTVVEQYMRSHYNKVTFRMCNFWLSKKWFRIDDRYFAYTLNPQRSMWRNIPEAYFRDRKMHNGDIQAVPSPHYLSPYRIEHYGYANERKTRDKYERYKIIDTGSSRDYEHLNPDQRTLRLPYIAFSNRTLNYGYILLYKYCVTTIALSRRIVQRVQKMF